ncbi:hypothetical protein [Leptospira harrisiae]|uniref:hypothetical protein n=1 Tax=Leptospira harrisiae TaxID=2023189 RepID=UPI000C2B154B|nr:hypothetical protein [Leptospira harrisiae]PKA10000.1 hypothetical protein CH366_10100 [Leptospira harrisiae]
MNKTITILALIFALQSCDKLVENQMADIENKVAEDSVEQYNIAKRQGDKIQICVQAGMVSAAYLQAKNETKYSEWKSIESKDCKAAGLNQ